ncbi:sugar ABC transporter substrate-binding protein [Pararhodobacter oceanensis]|uniref:Sugar ABC transporter substrate-binding protein n=2 Tax=Pararhodobacter oceanensis TaxID=2172121 RepID=A0A2T8HX40_9RHOB|nr:polysaccharide biosynthesis/export family protein [Pararhodobacter oceanensis]PVH29995.1 sugar ABC transporter substrate-binding protein [Pararhodobacter oceanensis]
MFAAGLSACSMPSSGPNRNEIFSGSVLREGDAYIVAVGDRVNRAANVPLARGFSDTLRNAALMGGDTIRIGDTVSLTVYENVPEGLLASADSRGATLTDLQVDSQGFIYVPFAGRVRAAGQTPEGLRGTIARQLDEQTPDPQVYVSRTSGDGATVSLVGSLGAQGVYPIVRPTRRLTAMLAAAGGVTIPTQSTVITVNRGSISDRVWLQDLFDHPELDIALRGGDRVLVEQDQRRFTVMGATGAQALVTFDSQVLTAIEALAQVGGLDATRADPTGVFVFRNEPAEVARNVLGRQDITGDQRLVYVLDLTAPNGMFMARDFQIRDGDTIYVTEASAVTWNRTIATLTGTLSIAGGAVSTAETAGDL